MTDNNQPEAKQNNTVVVVGAGIAGATAAYVLKREGFDVIVLEANDYIGGRCTTMEHDGFSIDRGAVYLLNLYERTTTLLAEAGYNKLTSWKPPAGLKDSTGTHKVQYDFLPSFLTLPALNISDKLRLIKTGMSVMLKAAPSPYQTDSLAAFDQGDTMEAWSRRNLGDKVHQYLVRPWIEPAFGVGVEKLSVPFLTGILKRAYRAKFHIPEGGMGDIAKTFLQGVDVRLETPARKLTRESLRSVKVETDSGTIDAIGAVVATTAGVSAELLRGTVNSEAIELMERAPYSTMVNLALSYTQDPWPDAPTDMVLPVGYGEHPVVGIILHGRKAPHRVPNGGQLINLYFNNTATSTMTDSEIIELGKRTVIEWLGTAPEPSFVDLFRHKPALAYAPPGHYANMQQVRRSMPSNIGIAGDFLSHLGIETAVVTGEEAAIELSRMLKQ